MESTNSPEVSEASAFSRMLNILAAPGEVYAEIKEKPVSHANWAVPAVVWAIIGFTLALLLFSQPWAINDIAKAQEKAIQKQVDDKKISQTQADQMIEGMRKFMPIVMKVGAGVGALVGAFGVSFLWGFVIWFMANKIFNADIEYMKGVEAAGLAMVIYMLAGIVATLIAFAVGRLTSVSPAFFLKDFDFANRSHLALAALNPFYLWFITVIAVSISVLAKAPLGKSLLWVGAFWLAMRALFLSNQFTAGWVM